MTALCIQGQNAHCQLDPNNQTDSFMTVNDDHCVSADENIMFLLCHEMNNVAEMKIAHASHEHVKFLSARTHNENDIQTAAIWNITSSDSEKNQESEIISTLSTNITHTHRLVQELCQELACDFSFCVDHFRFVKIVF